MSSVNNECRSRRTNVAGGESFGVEQRQPSLKKYGRQIFIKGIYLRKGKNMRKYCSKLVGGISANYLPALGTPATHTNVNPASKPHRHRRGWLQTKTFNLILGTVMTVFIGSRAFADCDTNGPTRAVVVPNYTDYNTTSSASATFAEVHRMQQVYQALQFPSGPILIKELRWRPSGTYGTNFSVTLSNVVIHLFHDGCLRQHFEHYICQ
jgi:hypothetical protein